MARSSASSTRRRRSTARPSRRRGYYGSRTVSLPGGMKVRVNRGSVSLSGRKGPVTQTISSSGRRTTTLRLPGGFSWRKSY